MRPQRFATAASLLFGLLLLVTVGQTPPSPAAPADFRVSVPSKDIPHDDRENLLDDADPGAFFTSPIPDAAFAKGAPISMTAEIRDDPDALIDHVNFWNGVFNFSEDSDDAPDFPVTAPAGVLTSEPGDWYLNVYGMDDDEIINCDTIVYHVIGADLSINSLSSTQEDDPGEFIPLRIADTVADFISLNYPGAFFNWQMYPDGEASLSKNETGTGRVKLWESSTCQTEITLPCEEECYWDMPSFAYLEGTAVSNAIGDVTLTQTYSLAGTTCSDSVKATVVSLTLPEVIMPQGDEVTIAPTVLPAAAANYVLPDMLYVSDDVNVVTVDVDGNNITVTGVSAGTTRILAMRNGTLFGFCDVCIYSQEMHPLSWEFTAGKEGRVLISTTQDDTYYTSAQTEDGKIKITYMAQVMDHSEELVGKSVHFRVIDPDDLSPYEPDTNGNDNRGVAGKLSSGTSTDTKTLVLVDDNTCKAETTLTFSNHSGDNYIVQATTRKDAGDNWVFDALSPQTPTLVAWKRIYIEYDQMYQVGATVTETRLPDGDNADNDEITVDNTSDFSVDDEIVLFTKDGDFFPTKVMGKSATTITIEDYNAVIYKYVGMKKVGFNDVYSVGFDYVPVVYGQDTDGSDGGVFVEYINNIQGSNYVPKYTSFTNQIIWLQYSKKWYNNYEDNANVFHVIAAYRYYDYEKYAFSVYSENTLTIFTGNFDLFANIENAIKETVIHEFAHLYELDNDYEHVDSEDDLDWVDWETEIPPGWDPTRPNLHGTPNYLRPTPSDACVMSHARIRDNDIAELDSACIYFIRDASDPM